MLRRTLLVATVVVLAAWLVMQTRAGVREPEPGAPVPHSTRSSLEAGCPDPGGDVYYFPAGTFSPVRGTPSSPDDFRRQWYSKHLRALEQLSLSCGAAPDPAYRFTYLRSFHHPVVVQIDTAGGSERWLSAWESSGAGGYEPGTVVQRSRRRLPPEEWADFQRRLVAADVCAQDAVVASTAHDGASWLVEVREQGAYCVAGRQSPRDGALRDLGMFFLDASGFVKNRSELY